MGVLPHGPVGSLQLGAPPQTPDRESQGTGQVESTVHHAHAQLQIHQFTAKKRLLQRSYDGLGPDRSPEGARSLLASSIPTERGYEELARRPKGSKMDSSLA